MWCVCVCVCVCARKAPARTAEKLNTTFLVIQIRVKVRSHQTRMKRITFWVYSVHSRVKFASFARENHYTTDANSRHGRGFCQAAPVSLQNLIPVFVKVRSKVSYSSGYPHTTTINLSFIVVLNFRNHVTARASSWLVNAARISAKVQIFLKTCLKALASKLNQLCGLFCLCWLELAKADFSSGFFYDLWFAKASTTKNIIIQSDSHPLCPSLSVSAPVGPAGH